MGEKEKQRLEGRGGARTSYTEFYSQFRRAGTAENGPPGEKAYRRDGDSRPATGAGSGEKLARAASDGILARTLAKPPSPRVMAAEAFLDKSHGVVIRHGPYWPVPASQVKPDSISTRKDLFQGDHKSIVDL